MVPTPSQYALIVTELESARLLAGRDHVEDVDVCQMAGTSRRGVMRQADDQLREGYSRGEEHRSRIKVLRHRAALTLRWSDGLLRCDHLPFRFGHRTGCSIVAETDVGQQQGGIPPEKRARLIDGGRGAIAREVAVLDGGTVDGDEDVILEGVGFAQRKPVMFLGILDDGPEEIGTDAIKPSSLKCNTFNSARPGPRFGVHEAGHIDVARNVGLSDDDGACDVFCGLPGLTADRQAECGCDQNNDTARHSPLRRTRPRALRLAVDVFPRHGQQVAQRIRMNLLQAHQQARIADIMLLEIVDIWLRCQQLVALRKVQEHHQRIWLGLFVRRPARDQPAPQLECRCAPGRPFLDAWQRERHFPYPVQSCSAYRGPCCHMPISLPAGSRSVATQRSPSGYGGLTTTLPAACIFSSIMSSPCT